MKSKVLQRKMFRDPSEDENVGIMQGFMDSLEEMLTGEGDMSEEEDDSPSGAPDRTPRSPEILMNTMRGDMRSVDARVEELADMVGYNAASSTPLEVLALLQPVLKQQGIAALEAAAPAMPDMGMAPLPGAMGMAPPPGAMGMAPPPTMEGGIGSLPQGNMGQPPMQMARGGPVQYFQDGSDGAGVTPVDDFTYPPELQAALRERILSQIGRAAVPIPDLMQRTQELGPQYKTLLGIDPSVSKGQMLFDVAQAALNYAGNVNPQGQSLRGSQAARLAGAFSGLPAAIGARAAEAQKQNQAIRMAAMQGAQSEIDAARATNTSREDTLDKMAIEAMKSKGAPRAMTEAEKNAFRITGSEASLPWGLDSAGKPFILGGRAAPSTTADSFSNRAGFNAADELNTSKMAATSALSTLNNIKEIRPILLDEGSVFSGPLSTSQAFVSRLAEKLGVAGGDNATTLANTSSVMQNLARFELDAAAAMRGQGAITENERALIKRASAGDLGTMTQGEVIELVNGLEKQANYRIGQHNALLNHYRDVYRNNPTALESANLFDIRGPFGFGLNSTPTPASPAPASGSGTPAVPLVFDPVAAQAELQRRAAGGN
jgi:hypothetical protein